MSEHPDRHDGCGGLWVGGTCTRCEALCLCGMCSGYDQLVEEFLDPDGAAIARGYQAQGREGGRWSEYDGE